jgi:hypothetical protein
MESNLVYPKNSFERFGDDLCELLLSYLSISDKIHFDCVSKQWQRLVFNKQKILISSDAQSSSVWRSVAKASAERERALERLPPSAEPQVIVHIFLNIRNTVKMFFIKYNFLHKNFLCY